MARATMEVESGGGAISGDASAEKRRRLQAGVVVWAKVKGYPWWPAVVRTRQRLEHSLNPEDYRLLSYSSDFSEENVRCVEFLNDENRVAVVHLRDLVEYSADMKLLSCAGQYRRQIADACDEADIFIKGVGPTYQKEACKNDAVPFISPPRDNIVSPTVSEPDNIPNIPLPLATAAPAPVNNNDNDNYDFDSSDDDLDVPLLTIAQSGGRTPLPAQDPPNIVAPVPSSPPLPNNENNDLVPSPPAVPMDILEKDYDDSPPTPEGHPPWTTPLTTVQDFTPPRSTGPNKSDLPMKLRLREQYAARETPRSNNTSMPRKRRRSGSPDLGVGNTIADTHVENGAISNETEPTDVAAGDGEESSVLRNVANLRKVADDLVDLVKGKERLKKGNEALEEQKWTLNRDIERIKELQASSKKALESVQTLVTIDKNVLEDYRAQVENKKGEYDKLKQQVAEEAEKYRKLKELRRREEERTRLAANAKSKHGDGASVSSAGGGSYDKGNINSTIGKETSGAGTGVPKKKYGWSGPAKTRILGNNNTNNGYMEHPSAPMKNPMLAAKTRSGAPVLPPLIPRRDSLKEGNGNSNGEMKKRLMEEDVAKSNNNANDKANEGTSKKGDLVAVKAN